MQDRGSTCGGPDWHLPSGRQWPGVGRAPWSGGGGGYPPPLRCSPRLGTPRPQRSDKRMATDVRPSPPAPRSGSADAGTAGAHHRKAPAQTPGPGANGPLFLRLRIRAAPPSPTDAPPLRTTSALAVCSGGDTRGTPNAPMQRGGGVLLPCPPPPPRVQSPGTAMPPRRTHSFALACSDSPKDGVGRARAAPPPSVLPPPHCSTTPRPLHTGCGDATV